MECQQCMLLIFIYIYISDNVYKFTYRMQAAITDVTAPQFRTTIFCNVWSLCCCYDDFIIWCMKIQNHFGLERHFMHSWLQKLLLYYIWFCHSRVIKKSNRKSLDDDKDLFAKNEDFAIRQSIELNKIGVEFDGNVQYDDIKVNRRKKCYAKYKKCCDTKHNPLRSLCYLRSNPVITWVAILSLLTAFSGMRMQFFVLIYIYIYIHIHIHIHIHRN